MGALYLICVCVQLVSLGPQWTASASWAREWPNSIRRRPFDSRSKRHAVRAGVRPPESESFGCSCVWHFIIIGQ